MTVACSHSGGREEKNRWLAKAANTVTRVLEPALRQNWRRKSGVLPLSDCKQFQYESRGRIWCGYPFERTSQTRDKKQVNGAQPRKYIGAGRAVGRAWARST